MMVPASEAAALLPARAASRALYDRARRCIYGFDVSDGLSWGIYTSVYSYYLVDVRGESERHASIKSSTGWAVGALGSTLASPLLATLSDLVGRRPLFLFSCTAQVVQLTMLGLLPGSTAAWDANMFVLGFLDATSALGKVVVVDCVDAGFPIGGRRDDCATRAVYGVLRGDGPQTSEKSYAVAFYYKWVLVGLGQLLGSGAVGYVLLSALPAKRAMLACGLVRLPMYAVLWVRLPETLPAAAAAGSAAVAGAPRGLGAALGDACRVAASLFARQLRTVPILCRSRRSRLLLAAFFCVHTAQAGVFSMTIYWGRREFGWRYGETCCWLATTQLAAGVGSVVLMRATMPAMGFRRAVACHVLVAAKGALLVSVLGRPLVGPRDLPRDVADTYGRYVVMGLGALVTQCFGVVPAVFSALTDRPRREGEKGQLQGALHASVTIASVCATTLFLFLYNTRRAPMCHHPNVIWEATCLLLFVAGFAITASGDPPKDEVDVTWAEAPGRPPREKDAYAAFNDHWGDDDDDDLPTATV